MSGMKPILFQVFIENANIKRKHLRLQFEGCLGIWHSERHVQGHVRKQMTEDQDEEWQYPPREIKRCALPSPTEKASLGEGTPARVARSQLLAASVSVASRLLTIPVFLLDFAQGVWRNIVQDQNPICLIFLKPGARDLCAITDHSSHLHWRVCCQPNELSVSFELDPRHEPHFMSPPRTHRDAHTRNRNASSLK